MKVEKEGYHNYQIYINKDYYQDIDISDKEKIGDYARTLVLRLKNHFGVILSGYYEMKIYVDDKIGMIIKLDKIEEEDYFETIDLKVIIFLHQNFYLKTTNFDYIKDFPSILYSRGFYYVNLSLIENVYPYLELGEIALKEVEEENLRDSLTLKRNMEY